MSEPEKISSRKNTVRVRPSWKSFSIRTRLLAVFVLLVLLPIAAVSISSPLIGFQSGQEQAIAVALIAVFLAVPASIYFARGIALPLTELAEMATRAAAGDLSLTVTVDGDDEIGALATAFNSMTAQLNRRIEMDGLVAEISRKCINLSHAEIDPAIDLALKDIGTYVGADRSYVFFLSEDGQFIDNAHEWRREGIRSRFGRLEGLPLAFLPWYMGNLENLEVVHISGIEDLPPEAAEEKREWEAEGIQSIVRVPMTYGGIFRGFVGFDSLQEKRVWSGEDIRLLRMVGEIICNTLERRRAERTLRASEEKFRGIFENAIEGIFQSTRDGRLLSANPAMARILGCDSPEDTIETYQDIPNQLYFDAEDRNDFLETLWRRGRTAGFETRMYRKNGDIIWGSVSARVVRGRDGRLLYFEGTLEDITERRKAEEEIRRLNEELERRVLERTAELQAANSELEAFSYSVSHDLRAPLRSIDGFSQALIEDYADQLDDDARFYLGRVRGASQHMGQVIDDMLHLSRVTRTEMKREELDLSTAVYEVIEELRDRSPDRDVEVEIEDNLLVKGDLRLIRVLLENLLGNAWKFTSRTKKAKIQFGREIIDGAPAYFVRDNGAGFDMTYAGKLFDAFQRLHPREEFEGTGIGLAIVDRVVRRHGGKVWAESEIGKGAVFHFSLEAKQQSESIDEQQRKGYPVG